MAVAAVPTPLLLLTIPLSVFVLAKIPGNSKSHLYFTVRTDYLKPTLTTNGVKEAWTRDFLCPPLPPFPFISSPL